MAKYSKSITREQTIYAMPTLAVHVSFWLALRNFHWNMRPICGQDGAMKGRVPLAHFCTQAHELVLSRKRKELRSQIRRDEVNDVFTYSMHTCFGNPKQVTSITQTDRSSKIVNCGHHPQRERILPRPPSILCLTTLG
eukprot:TRINITY_DN2326_c0_g1_i4.p3 TRINITY_DN2326_c0_g1~~TRINITY_DN2326_c0_g1_i4.p3  ORF type:complete len:138 (+),score=1.19 TRINITY_DN2326_c0_g1_i4:642-1055(+)